MNTLLKRSREGMQRYIELVSRPARRIWPRTTEALLGVLALAIIALVLLTYSPSLARSASLWLSGNKYIALVDGLSNPFRNRNLLLQSGLPVYDLKIKAKPYAELEAVVAEARSQGWMSEDQKVEVNARFFHDDREYDAKVRIRGDLPIHWEGPKKSWRIKFTKQKLQDGDRELSEPVYFQGRRQINLIVPRDRDYVIAPLMNDLLQEAGLTVPRDQYVVLRINGRLQGLYYEVEHFDAPLLAAKGRPEGTIFGQNDRAMHFEQYTQDGTPITADAKYDAGTLRLQVEEELGLGRQAMEILLEHSRNPTPDNFAKARAVLDWQKFQQFRAMTTLLCTNHVRFGSDNLKLYYDPSRGMLEPIPWDMHLVRMPVEPGTLDYFNSHGPDELQRATLQDPHLRLERNRILWKLVDDGGERLLKRYDTLHDQLRPLAWVDVLSTPIQGDKMDVLRSDFRHNVRRVHKVLAHSAGNVTFRLLQPNEASVDVTALNFCGIHVSEMQLSFPAQLRGSYQLYEDANDNGLRDAEDRLVGEAESDHGVMRFRLDELVLPSVKYRGELLDGQYWEFFDTLSGRKRFFLIGNLTEGGHQAVDWKPPHIVVKATNAATGYEMPCGPINSAVPLPSNSMGVVAYDSSHFLDVAAPQRTREQFLEAYPEFVGSSDQPNEVELRGKCELKKTVIVPRGVTLRLAPGAEISLGGDVSVVCYGGLVASATAEQPIRVHAADKHRAWGVIGVVRPEEKAVLHHVHFSGGSQAIVNGIQFTGGLAVHHGNVDLDSCRFEQMQGADAVNIKNGHVDIRGCLFAHNLADGCDLDFVTGSVAGSHYIGNGVDGLECSGTEVLISSCRFEKNSRRGCSVGEVGHPTLVNCLFVGNGAAVTFKDSSFGQVAFCTFVDNTIALESLRSNAVFSGGGAEVFNSVLANNDHLITEDYFSRNQVQLHASWLDTSVSFPTCRAEVLSFRDSDAGDYRLVESAAQAVPLPTPAFLSQCEMPDGLRVPGIYSELRRIAAASRPAEAVSPERD